MSVKTILQESINKNPLGLREALKEELSERISYALKERLEQFSIEEK